MEELGPKSAIESTDADPKKEKKRSRSKKSQRETASLGGLAANESLQEGSIWQREKEEDETTKHPLLDVLKHEKSKAEKPAERDEVEPPTRGETDESTTSEQAIEEDEETEDVAAQDAELAKLSPDEIHQASSEYVQIRSMEVAAEQATVPSGSPEAAALEADAGLLDKLRDILDTDPEMSADAAATQAYDETLAAYDLHEQPMIQHQGREQTTGEEDAPLTPPETSPDTVVHPAAHVAEQALRTELPFEMQQPTAATPAAPRTATEHAASMLTPAGEAAMSYHDAMNLERRSQTRGLLVGGVVGYLVGRRRGRIKTERRMKPIQEQLEKQVHELHDTIARKEQEVRVLAAEKVAAANAIPKVESIPVQEPPTHIEQHSQITAATQEQVLKPQTEKPTPVEKTPVPVFEALAAPVIAGAGPEALKARQVEAKPVPISSLSTPELLEVAQHVVIGNENLRDIYESKRITEPGLRNLMEVYVRGGNVKKALKQELINKELTYERDPRMRQGLAVTLSSAGVAAGAVAKVAAKTKPKISKHSKKLAVTSRKVGKTMIEKSMELEKQDQQIRQFVVRIWLGVTVFLAVVVLILLIR